MLTSNIVQLAKNQESSTLNMEDHLNKCLIQNIRNNNCSKKTISEHVDHIRSFAFQDHFAASQSDRCLRVRNMETGECFFECWGSKGYGWKEIIKIIDGKIVCTGGLFSDNSEDDIQIYDLKTCKRTAKIDKMNFDSNKVCMIGRRIFAVLNGTIAEWNMEGNIVPMLQSEKLQNSQLLASDFFLVHFDDKTIIIYDIEKSEIKTLPLVYENGLHPNITASHLNGKRLICGFKKHLENPDCCIIDLESGKMTHHHFAKEDFLFLRNNDIKKKDLKEAGSKEDLKEAVSVERIILHNDWIFLGQSTGILVAVNLAKKIHKILDKHHNPIHELVVDGEILISGSYPKTTMLYDAEMKFWDIKSLEKIGEIKLDWLQKVYFVSGKVFAAVLGKVVEWDYGAPDNNILIKNI